MRNINSKKGQISIVGNPCECPFCRKAITPNFHFGYINELGNLEVFVSCPDQDCQKTFIGYYRRNGGYWIFDDKTSSGEKIGREFSDSIKEISDSFVVIYNQSFVAEQQNLTDLRENLAHGYILLQQIYALIN
jgi:hypothetical protein